VAVWFEEAADGQCERVLRDRMTVEQAKDLRAAWRMGRPGDPSLLTPRGASLMNGEWDRSSLAIKASVSRSVSWPPSSSERILGNNLGRNPGP
jgi:hypothetical protein